MTDHLPGTARPEWSQLSLLGPGTTASTHLLEQPASVGCLCAPATSPAEDRAAEAYGAAPQAAPAADAPTLFLFSSSSPSAPLGMCTENGVRR